jgi:hypothetical protein
MEQSSLPLYYTLIGDFKKRKSKDNKKDIILDVYITSRVICIKNKNVSSVASDPKSVIQKLKDDNGNLLRFFAVISSQDSDNKQVCLAHLSKLKVVRKNGRNMLEMTASANEFAPSGNFAQDSINLDQFLEGKKTMTILSENDDEFKIASVAQFLNQVIALARNQNPFQSIVWINLPGSRPIVFGSRVNWEYLAFSRNNDFPAVQVNNNRLLFFFRGRDINGNITETAAFTRQELPNNMSLFGIDNYANWRQRYGYLFGL